jgi:acyl-CoA synthetase
VNEPADGFRTVTDPERAAEYRRRGWWSDVPLAAHVRRHADRHPDRAAFVADAGRLTWAGYHLASDRVAAALVAAGFEPGQRVAVLLPDSATVHAVFVGIEKAGLTIVGIGARAGDREIRHLLDRTGAVALVTIAEHRGESSAGRVARLRRDGASLAHHLVVPLFERDLEAPIVLDGAPVAAEVDRDVLAARALGPDDLWLINSTSGTTGLPKCVMHHQNRWLYFHQQAARNGALVEDDVFLGAVPAPFGFGIWTAHVTPAVLGATTVLTERFDAARAVELVERERVSVLCCVSTQFVMMLNEPSFAARDVTSLRVMYTGGEAVPYERARAFEASTRCTILQFFGSNETGLLSGTTLDDPPDKRLRTAGRVVPEMQVRLFDGAADVTARGRGQPACRGPATCLGYLGDPEANRQLFTPDGWVLTGDVCEIDGEGYLTVTGRASDIIIRGGKNISAAQVEDEVGTHPAVAMVAAVALPDAVVGERVCVYVELQPGATLGLDALVAHLTARGTSKEILPEHLVVVDRLPRSSGGKVAKGDLREDARRRAAPAASEGRTTG